MDFPDPRGQTRSLPRSALRTDSSLTSPNPASACAVAAAIAAGAMLLGACGPVPVAKADSHIQPLPTRTASANIPQPVTQVALPPPPRPRAEEVRYSIVVNDVPVRDVLFAMAKGTNVNIDIHPGIEGRVTLNAIDQTLRQILTRVAKQVDMRFETDGPNIVVMPDSPYLKIYKVDYLNMSRDTSGTVGIQSQVVGPGGSSGGSSTASSAQNSSLLKIDNNGKNRFWETLERNVKDLLRETDKLLPEGSSETFVRNSSQNNAATTQTRTQAAAARRNAAGTPQTTQAPGATEAQASNESLEQRLTFREAASVIVNAETGTVIVRATGRQHERITEFLQQVVGSAKRQVLIEATVVEVVLNDNYQSGVDWSALGVNGAGYSVTQNFLGTRLNAAPFFSLQYSNPSAAVGGSIKSTLKLLDSFGNTRVLSSPKIMALNNQTAVLKVVENTVYFSIQSQITQGTLGAAPLKAFTTTQYVVPVGFVMSVTPQISEDDIVVLNVRPSVSRITDFVNDPNPDLATAGVQSRIPEIQTREFESMIRVASGQTAILGGLMQDSTETNRDGLPVLSRVPVFGDAVSFRNDTTRKSELVIFLRPIVIKDASINSDLSDYRKYLPDGEFFKELDPVFPSLYPKDARAKELP